MQRNGFYLPARKASIITEDYLIGVMEGSLHCPRVDHVRLRNCPRPPLKRVILNKVLKALHEKGLEKNGIDADHVPDKKWLLDVLSTHKPDDEVFSKDYYPPAREKNVEEVKTVDV